jgi:hypothetical protein
MSNPPSSMDSILTAHNLDRLDVEPEALQMCLSGLYDTEAMERVARISATNKHLNSHGFPGLPLFPPKKQSSWEIPSSRNEEEEADKVTKSKKISKDNDNDNASDAIRKAQISQMALKYMSSDDIQKGADMGLTKEEYYVVKGNYGMLFNLELDHSTFQAMMKKCKHKTAIRLRSNQEKSIKYLKAKLVHLARLKLNTFKIPDLTEKPPTEASPPKRNIDLRHNFGSKNVQQANNLLKAIMDMHPTLPQGAQRHHT